MPMTKAANPACVRKTAILAVSGNQTDLSMLRCLFAGSSWVLHTAGSLAEADLRFRGRDRRQARVQVVDVRRIDVALHGLDPVAVALHAGKSWRCGDAAVRRCGRA